jgi:hypothetical protein
MPDAEAEQDDSLRECFDEITRGVSERPIPVRLTEGTCGILEIDWNERVLPILASYAGVFVAASTLGEGRIVAFSGQDFISSDETSTFIGMEGNDTLVRNAVRWASDLEGSRQPRVLVDNSAVAGLLEAGGCDVRVASIQERRPASRGDCPIETRDWTAAALSEVDVAVVQVNEWDTTRVGQNEIASLRAFVERGGGLLIAGSCYHWCGEGADFFPGKFIVAGSGIRWDGDEEPDLASARLVSGPLSSSVALWQAYLDGGSVEALDMARLPDLFASVARLGRVDEVNRALRRVLSETPELPVSTGDPNARLSADVAMALGPFAWPTAHPWAATFPGLPDPDAERTERVVEVDTSWTGARPLGLYAPPGEVITLRFADEQASLGLWVDVGDDYDDLRSSCQDEEWCRAPCVGREYEVDASLVSVSNPYGGPLYLMLPDGPGARSPGGRITVTVQGAIAMAVYTLGETRMPDWERDLGRGAPQAILQARGRVRFVVPTLAAAKVADPDRILEFWSGFHASHAELAQEPAPRRFESHWIFDPQVGGGYANANNGRVALPFECVGMAWSTIGEYDYWTIGHELGHQFQTDDWSDGDLSEVAVNLFTLYTKNGYIHGGGEFETVGWKEDHYRHEDLVDFRWDDVDEWGKLQLYRQLVLCFGWTSFKRTFASYYDPAYPREEYGGHLDGFAIRFSAIVQRDLTGFFRHWKYPLSDEAAAKISSFGYEPWMPPGW